MLLDDVISDNAVFFLLCLHLLVGGFKVLLQLRPFAAPGFQPSFEQVLLASFILLERPLHRFASRIYLSKQILSIKLTEGALSLEPLSKFLSTISNIAKSLFSNSISRHIGICIFLRCFSLLLLLKLSLFGLLLLLQLSFLLGVIFLI